MTQVEIAISDTVVDRVVQELLRLPVALDTSKDKFVIHFDREVIKDAIKCVFQPGEGRSALKDCDCSVIPYLEYAGQHSPGCSIFGRKEVFARTAQVWRCPKGHISSHPQPAADVNKTGGLCPYPCNRPVEGPLSVVIMEDAIVGITPRRSGDL